MNPGTRLCHFELLEPLGAGGMGEVYRAQDTHLRREVAIKLLPTELSSDPERLARLQREAQLLAALNHPNVAAIHSLEQEADTRFLVMELVEGETLAEHLQRGPLPVELALRIAAGIARALEAAHEAGIIHRDLKPANVKITPDVTVKVLDFGLAKATDAGPSTASTDLSRSPTLMGAPTGTGVILGTAAYMSPEQTRGRALDKRTDIWSFGLVLYEMLTGTSPFSSGTLSDTLAGILKEDPDWTALPDGTPAQVRLLLRRCTQKDRAVRLRDIGDARIEIDDALGASGEVRAALPGTVVLPEPRPLWQSVLPWALVAVMAAVAAFAVWSARRPAPPAAETMRMEMNLGDAPLRAGSGGGVVLSPDGSWIAYVVGGDAATEGLYLRTLSQLEGARLVDGLALYPFFSPDGQWVGYEKNGELWKVAVTGGSPLLLALDEPGEASFATWGPDESIVYASASGGGALSSAPATGGGDPGQLTELKGEELRHVSPQVLPGGKGIVFTSVTKPGLDIQTTVEVLDLETRQRQVVHRGGKYGRYVASGHLAYVAGGSLFAVPFDLDRLEVTGPPVSVLQGVGTGSILINRCPPYSFAENGTLLYLRPADRLMKLLRVDRAGGIREVWDTGAFAVQPVLSPDGTRVALSLLDDERGTFDVHVYDLERDVPAQVTFDPATDVAVAWTPDGGELVFMSDRGGEPGDSRGPRTLYRRRSDGTGQVKQAAATGSVDASFSADGQMMAYEALRDDGTAWEIWVQALEGESEPEFVTEGVHPRLSPDGHWIAFTSFESGQFEVYVQPYPLVEGGKQKASNAGGGQPQWSGDGRELYYRTDGGAMVVAAETERGVLRLGRPDVLFESPFSGSALGTRIQRGGLFVPDFAASPDGQSFFLASEREAADATAPHVTMVFNWFEELKQRVPTGR